AVPGDQHRGFLHHGRVGVRCVAVVVPSFAAPGGNPRAARGATVPDPRFAATGDEHGVRLESAADGADETGRRPLQSCGESQPCGDEYLRPAAPGPVEQRPGDALGWDRTGATVLVRAATA